MQGHIATWQAAPVLQEWLLGRIARYGGRIAGVRKHVAIRDFILCDALQTRRHESLLTYNIPYCNRRTVIPSCNLDAASP